MILHGHVKQCKNMSLLFLEGGWGCEFQNVFVIGQSKWLIANFKNKRTCVPWDAPQPIKLINMDHNKYPSFLKSLS